jgi:hypothetical protein
MIFVSFVAIVPFVIFVPFVAIVPFVIFVAFEIFVAFVFQKSSCALILKNRPTVIDSGFRYVAP